MAVWPSASFYLCSLLLNSLGQWRLASPRLQTRSSLWSCWEFIPSADHINEMWIMFSLHMDWPCSLMCSVKSLRWWAGRTSVSEAGRWFLGVFSWRLLYLTLQHWENRLRFCYKRRQKLFHCFPSPPVQIQGETALKNKAFSWCHSTHFSIQQPKRFSVINSSK